MNYYITLASKNSKVGQLPVATIGRETCPTSCPLRNNGCYADGGPLRLHWDKVTKGERGGSFNEFIEQIKVLPEGQVWRYGQAGDLPGKGDLIDREQLKELVEANNNRPVIAYTHKPPVGNNLRALKHAVANGFSVNLSADSFDEADTLAATGLPVVVVLPSEYGRGKGEDLASYNVRVKDLPQHTPGGLKIAVCPATYTDTTCGQCLACAKSDRNDVVIGFPAHGNKKNVINRAYQGTPDHKPVDHRTGDGVGAAL